MADALSIPMPFDALLSTRVTMINGQKIDHLSSANPAIAWVKNMQQPQNMILNWSSEMHVLQYDHHYYPIAIGKTAVDQTYLSAPTSGYIGYARDELDQIQDPKTRRWADRLLAIATPWFNSLALDRSVSLNADGVSTQLYPNWSRQVIDDMTHQLCDQFPDRPLWMRTLNGVSDAELMARLVEAGWTLWPNRQVYLFDPKYATDWINRRNNQIDQKLLRTTPLIAIGHDDFTVEDTPIMADLYEQLYLQKHSHWNAHYTAKYFEEALKHRWCEFIGYRDANGKLLAFIGIYANKTSMTTPMLGYDTQQPQNMGLYRLLMGRVMLLSVERSLLLNLGAGASSFKKMRGGTPELEWHAFYSDHLSTTKKLRMNLTAWLMRKTVPSFLNKQGV